MPTDKPEAPVGGQAKHTPGPWSWWSSNSFRRLSSASGKDGDVLCAVVQRSDGHPDVHFSNGGFDGPDARLIAAAPEMLEALRHVASGRSGYLNKVRAAIAKATGEPT